jgi:hypothetical protein
MVKTVLVLFFVLILAPAARAGNETLGSNINVTNTAVNITGQQGLVWGWKDGQIKNLTTFSVLRGKGHGIILKSEIEAIGGDWDKVSKKLREAGYTEKIDDDRFWILNADSKKLKKLFPVRSKKGEDAAGVEKTDKDVIALNKKIISYLEEHLDTNSCDNPWAYLCGVFKRSVSVDAGLAYDSTGVNTGAVLLGWRFGNLLSRWFDIPFKDAFKLTIYPVGLYIQNLTDNPKASGCSGIAMFSAEIKF